MAAVIQTISTPTQVANLAIGACGISKPLADLVNDKSLAGQMCRTYFDTARRKVLQDFAWPFAKNQINPVLATNFPTPEWNYAYVYPPDCLKILRFISWRLSNDTRQSRIPYTIMQPSPVSISMATPKPVSYGNTGSLWIFTNWPGVGTAIGLPTVLEYIFDHTNVSQWTDTFIDAFGLRLAVLIAPTITSGDPYGMQQKLIALYQQALDQAASSSLNEEQRDEEPQSEFIRVREVGDLYGIPGGSWQAQPAGFQIF